MLEQLTKYLNSIDINYKFRSSREQSIDLQIIGTNKLLNVFSYLKTELKFYYQQLIDLTVIDYLHFGNGNWQTESIHNFAKAITPIKHNHGYRFGVKYNLLSFINNNRIKIMVLLTEDLLTIPSVTSIWPNANWYEREAFDLFGIFFTNHPNLTKIFNTNDFCFHPFRKDFPISGFTEIRFDAKANKIITEPKKLENQGTIPKVVRHQATEELL